MQSVYHLLAAAAVAMISGCSGSDSALPTDDGNYAIMADSTVTLVTVVNGNRSDVVGEIEGIITGATRFKPQGCPAFLFVPNGAAPGEARILPTRPGSKRPTCRITENMINAKWVIPG